jgi:hypothetical protein
VSRIPCSIPLEADGKALYLVHPQGWPRVDVVVIPFYPEQAYPTEISVSTGKKMTIAMPLRSQPNEVGLQRDLVCLQDVEGLHKEYNGMGLGQMLGLADDLFILGYPKGMTDFYGRPIWKRATVASEPQFGMSRQKKFFVDCASREGMSGAPVIQFHKTGNVSYGSSMTIGMGPSTFLHGIYTSRVGKTTEFEAQIGTVWGRGVIDEIINGGLEGAVSQDLPLAIDEVRQTIQTMWPNSPDFLAMIRATPSTAGGFAGTVLDKLQSRVDPETVLKEIHAHGASL